MRKPILPLAATVVAMLASAAPAAAQDAPTAAPLADMAQEMRDPARQRDMAMMAQTMTEVLLDMPIAPLAQAAAEMAGEQAERIDPDTTLRKMVPDAGRLSAEIGRNTPRAMQAMGTMAAGFAAMAPQLRAMAEKMAEALPRSAPETR